MLCQLLVTHKPRRRTHFPWSWQRVDEIRLVTLTEQGKYWFESMQKRDDVEVVTLTNLDSNEVLMWKRGDKHVTLGLTSTRWSTDTKPITEDPTRKRLLEVINHFGTARLIPQRKFLWFWLTYRNHPIFLNKETALLWLEGQ